MSNFTLIDASASTLAITVQDPESFRDVNPRAGVEIDARGTPHARGDGVELAQPFSLQLLIDSSGDQLAAYETLSSIVEFARASAYLKDDGTGDYRALQAGNAVQSFTPVAKGRLPDVFEATLTLVPLYGRWTTTQVNTDSGYAAATKV